MVRHIIIYILLFIPFNLFSQEDIYLELPDSIRSMPTKSFINPAPFKYEYYKDEMNVYPSLGNKPMMHIPTVKTNNLSLLKGDFKVSGVIRQFDNGTISGRGIQRDLPGIGRFNQAGLSYYYLSNKKLSIKLNVNAYKLHSPYFYDNSLGFSGVLSYPVQDNIKFNFWGTYIYSLTSKMPYYNYGFSTTFEFTERFGTEVGVEHSYDPFRQRKTTTPVLIPYYKFDKATIGMDVGGILKYVVEELVK